MKKKQIVSLIGLSILVFSFIAIQGESVYNDESAAPDKFDGSDVPLPDQYDENEVNKAPSIPEVPLPDITTPENEE